MHVGKYTYKYTCTYTHTHEHDSGTTVTWVACVRGGFS